MQHLNVSWCWKREHAESKREESRKCINLTRSHSIRCSVAQLRLTLCNLSGCSTTGFPVFHKLRELAQTHVHGARDAIQPSHPLSSPSIFLNNRVFSNGSVLHITWPEYWGFKLSICPSNEYSGLISFRIHWFDLHAVQGIPTPQFKSINSSALSFLCIPTLTSIRDYWKNHSFDYMNLFRQSISLPSNMLSSLVTAFLPRSKHILNSWLQSPSAEILEPKK